MILQENGFHNPAAIFAAAQRTICRNRRLVSTRRLALKAPVASARLGSAVGGRHCPAIF